MAPDADPYRTLGLARGATLDDVRSAYRRLVKANHPDRAGEAALPRFLAIQAAYDQIAGPDGGPRPAAGPPSSRPSSADPDRSGATHRAYGGRTRRTRASAGPRPGSRSGTGDSTSARSGSGPDPFTGSPGRPPNKATLGSTSYDGADAEAFEPDWGGASWYGTTSGTYWTLNPKEYADPRKHGPEYQARARRQRKGAAVDPAAAERGKSPSATLGGASVADPATETAADAPAGTGTASDMATDAPASAPTHTATSWWQATAGDPTRTTTTEAAPTGTRPARHAPGAPGRPERAASPSNPSDPSAGFTTDTVMDALRAWLVDGRPGVGARVGRAVFGWAPIALGIGWLAGEITGCARFSADCDPAVAPVSWLAQIVALLILLLVSGAARVATAATIATIAAVIPGAILLLATHDPGAVNAGRSALGGLMVIAWGTGLAYGLVREARMFGRERGPGGPGPVS